MRASAARGPLRSGHEFNSIVPPPFLLCHHVYDHALLTMLLCSVSRTGLGLRTPVCPVLDLVRRVATASAFRQSVVKPTPGRLEWKGAGLAHSSTFHHSTATTWPVNFGPTSLSRGAHIVWKRKATTHVSPAAAVGPSRPNVDAGKEAGPPEDTARRTRPAVAYHLFFCAALVYLIIVVGGLTRLTESGLSITEWNPGFKGMRLPWTEEEWEEEWAKYKQTPEWTM